MDQKVSAQSQTELDEKQTWIHRIGEVFTQFAMRYFPDSFVIAILLSIGVFIVATLVTKDPIQVASLWGASFWNLLTFGMQMVIIIVAGFVLATAPPVLNGIRALASIPQSERSSAVYLAFVGIVANWINWGFALILSSVLARELNKRFPKGDYRLLAFCAFFPICLGIGQNGISGSAVLLVATAGSLPQAIKDLMGGTVIPVTETIFTWQTTVFSISQFLLGLLLIWLVYPNPGKRMTSADLGIVLNDDNDNSDNKSENLTNASFIQRLENSRPLMYVFVALGAVYIVNYFSKGVGLAGINLNIVNFLMLFIGMALHGTPRALLKSVEESIGATVGVVIQFPLYAGIFGMIALTPLGHIISDFFVQISGRVLFPGIIAIYSGLLGIIVPSAGSKFVLEAPYIFRAANELNVSLAWVTVCYGYGEALANFIQPFWMIPALGILKIHPKYLIGFGITILCFMAPLIFIMSVVLGLFI